MPTISQPPAQDKFNDSPRNRVSAPLVLLSFLAVFYGALLIAGTLRGYRHLHLMLLSVQYAFVLPGVLWFLRSQKAANRDHPLPRMTFGLALILFALVAIPLSRFSAQGILNPDESGYSFQARIYRSGHIMADPLMGAKENVRQTPAELFYENHILLSRGWFTKFPPGWPLVLSFGYLISAGWLMNPVFGLLQLFVIATIGKRLFHCETGVVAVFFGIFSPFFLVNSIGMMSHALCALLSVVACMAVFQAFATGRLWYYAAMFGCLAAMLQVRPYTGFVLTIAITISALWLNRTDRSVVLRVFSIGAVFGCVALACLFLYNHIYTGRWLVSPYAMAAGIDTPPELSLDPAKIWRGLQQYAPQTAEETLAGSFPFVYLLAGYALVREKNRRKEVWILASIYLALVIAYLAHPDGSGVFFGERFHFEGFFVVLLLAARGWQLLLDHWRFPRWAAVWTMLLFAAMQILQLAATVRTVADRVEPYRKVREAVMASGVTGLVLLHDSPGFVAKHFNLNEADWRHAPRIYLIDAEPDRRDEWACRYGVSNWTVITYGAKEDSASVLPGTPNCTNLRDDRTP